MFHSFFLHSVCGDQINEKAAILFEISGRVSVLIVCDAGGY